MEEDLHVNIERDGHRAIVRVAGEIDLATKERLSGALAQALDATDIVVDLTEVTFVDSTGIGLFLMMHRFAAEAGRSLSFLGATERVQRTFALAGLSEVLRFVEVQEATQPSRVVQAPNRRWLEPDDGRSCPGEWCRSAPL